MKYGFVAAHRGIWPIDVMCGALGVSRSGFYAWRTRPPSARALANARLDRAVRRSFEASDRTYGVRRVWHDVLAAGLETGRHRVARRMRLAGLRARPRRRRRPTAPTSTASITAANVLARDFAAPGPNQKWVADFTYVWTAEGWLFVAVVLDLFSRRIIGWAMRSTMATQLVTDALVMAVWRRGTSQAVVHHSDRGSQYTSEHFQRLLGELGITCSMSRAGNVWDNSAVESFFSSLKTERTSRRTYRTRAAARADIFEYIERFYNPVRRHSTLGYVSPMEYERQAQEA